MRQRFFTNTIQSNFIKALIYNTPIPLIDTVNDNSYLLKNNVYIYKSNIIKCTVSGVLKMPETPSGYTPYYRNGDIKFVPTQEDRSFVDYSEEQEALILPTKYVSYEKLSLKLKEEENNITSSFDDESGSLSISEDDSADYQYIIDTYIPLTRAKYRIIDTFVFGKYYPKFTELYCSNYSYYDTKTHEYLGKLLRAYRDIYEINLMPYYNCISGDYISGIIIYDERIKEEDSKDYKTFKVPIKYNTTYTLAIDCNNKVKVAPVLLSNNHIVDNISLYNSSGSNEEFTPTTELLQNNIQIFDSISFKRPVTVGVNILNKEHSSLLQMYEKYLYLLIQVPKGNTSSIVLLEGDYTEIPDESIYNVEGISNLNDLELSNIFTSDLSLLQMNNNITYPYAKRLIEYLLLNVIHTRDEITKNIERIQDLFVNDVDSVPEVWDNKLRSDVYINYQKIPLARKLDLNGFVDIDTETLIKKLKDI